MERTGDTRLRLKFLAAYTDFVQANSSIPCWKPHQWNLIPHPIGRPATFIFSKVTSSFSNVTSDSQPELRVELVLGSKNSKQDFAALQCRKGEIENAIDLPLSWYNPPNRRVCRIYTGKHSDFRNPELWPEQQRWLLQTVEKFHDVFIRVLKEIDH